MIAASSSPNWLPLVLAPVALLAWVGVFVAIAWIESWARSLASRARGLAARVSALRDAYRRVEATTATVRTDTKKEVEKPARAHTIDLFREPPREEYRDTAFNGFDGWAELAEEQRNARGWLPPQAQAALIEGCEFVDCTFAEPLSGVRFHRCSFTHCKFHTELRSSEFDECKFTSCDLSWCSFQCCKLKFSQFTDCGFAASVFMRCDLYRTSFFEPASTFSEVRFALVSVTRASLGATSGIDGDSFSAQSADTSLVPGRDVPELNDQEAKHRRNLALAAVQRAPALIQEDLAEYSDMLVQTGSLTTALYPTLNQRLAEAGGVWRALAGLFEERGEFRDAARAYVRAKRLERRDTNPLRKRFLLPKPPAHEPPRRPGLDGGPEWPLRRTPSQLGSRLGRYVRLLLADALCGFGDAWARILLWLAALSALLAALLTVFHGLRTERTVPGLPGHPAHVKEVTSGYFEAWEFAVGQLATSPAHEFKPHTIGWELAASVETLVGVALVGLLGFVIANRLRFA